MKKQNILDIFLSVISIIAAALFIIFGIIYSNFGAVACGTTIIVIFFAVIISLIVKHNSKNSNY